MEVIKATAKKWGSSIGIIIPKDVVEKQKIREGQDIEIFLKRPIDVKKSREAWKRLQEVGKEASKKWKGPSAVEEIKEQRTKKW